MKKIIIIIVSIFLLSGCNYIELNDMGIVSLMVINYDNNNYNITLELRENIKEDIDTSTIHKGSGQSIEKALQDAALTIDKNLYFIDLNVIMLDQKTANEKLTSIVDYLTRDVTFGTNFTILIDDNPEEAIKLITSKQKIAGEYIKNIFDNTNNNLINYKYDEFLKDYVNKYKDIILPVGRIKNDDYIIDEAVIFNDSKIVDKLDLNMIQTYNLLNNVKAEYFYKIVYQDKTLVYRLSNHKVKTTYDDKVNIDVKLNGSFIEIEDINLLDENTLNEILIILNNKIKDDINLLVLEAKSFNSDILGIKKKFFNKERIRINTIKNIDYKVNVDLSLDREGLIFNSLGDLYEKNK